MKNIDGALYECTIKPLAKQKRITCKVCGLEFVPMNDEGRYTVKDWDGVMSDAFDCPQCGCQVIANERYERVDPTESIKLAPKKPKYRSYYEKACESYNDFLRKSVGPNKYTFPNVKQFTRALELIHECMDDYNYFPLSGWKNIIGESGSCVDELVGWDNILDMKIEVDGNGYTIIMPPFNWRCDRH